MDPFLEEQQQSGGGFDPVSLFRAFWRRKMLFFVPFVLCLAMAAVAIKTMEPIYASRGQVQIKFEGLNSDLLTDPSQRFGRSRNIDKAAYREMDMLLTSPDFLEKMVLAMRLQDLELAKPVPKGGRPMTEERAIRVAKKHLENQMQLKEDGARLFRLEVRDSSPERAYEIVSFILESFVEDYRASQMASSTSTREFLQGQLSGQEEKLAAAEVALNEYLVSLASAALLDNPINAINLSDGQANLLKVKNRHDGTDARELEELQLGIRALLGGLPGTSRYQTDDIVRSTTLEMETVGLELNIRSAGTQNVRELETRLGQLRVRLNTRVESLVALEYPSLAFLDRNQISQYIYFSLYRTGTQRVISRLESSIQEFRDFATRRPGQSARMAELQEDVVGARGLVSSLEKEIAQHTMNLEASISEIGMQISIRKYPQMMYGPVEPDKMRLTLMGVVLSVGIGLGLVFLAIFLDRSFNSVEDIESTLGVTVIGTLPVVQDDHFERKKKLRVLRWITIIAGIVAVGAIGFLVIYPRLG